MLLFMPTLVYSEENCVKNHFKDIALIGEKAMIITGKHSSRSNGSLSDVTEVLEKENISYIIFDDIEENPSVETVMKARELGIREQVDFVIGIPVPGRLRRSLWINRYRRRFSAGCFQSDRSYDCKSGCY